jgi:hypothetical protein
VRNIPFSKCHLTGRGLRGFCAPSIAEPFLALISGGVDRTPKIDTQQVSCLGATVFDSSVHLEHVGLIDDIESRSTTLQAVDSLSHISVRREDYGLESINCADNLKRRSQKQ